MDSKSSSILLEGIPYIKIKEFIGKTIVIKYGGSIFDDKVRRNNFIEDLAILNLIGINIVLIHGGGPEIKKSLEKLEIKNNFYEGIRITDSKTMDVVEKVLSGNINKKIAKELCEKGLKGIGLSGKNNNLIRCKKKVVYRNDVEIDLGQVGEITDINLPFLNKLINLGYIPAIAPIGLDEHGRVYNINADIVAGEISGTLCADKLVLVTDVPGLLMNSDDLNSLISKVDIDDLEMMKTSKRIDGGMIPKIDSCINAIKKGTKTVHIINGKDEHSILKKIFTSYETGTTIVGRDFI